MKAWIIIAMLLTPWFWSLPVPKNLFNLNFKNDIKEAHTTIEWERGKITNSDTNILFSNWLERFIDKRLSIVMENIDIGNYFFSGHPRERVGVEEKQKFFFFQFILFLIGLTNRRLRKYTYFLICYSVIVLSCVFVFKWRSFEGTIPLSIPFVIVIALGLERIFKWPKKWLIPFCAMAILEIIAFCVLNFKGFLK